MMRSVMINNVQVWVDPLGGLWLDREATRPFDAPGEEALPPEERAAEAEAVKEIDRRMASGAEGLGDVLQAFLARVGVERAVKFYEKVMGRRCRCGERKAWLNRFWPFKGGAGGVDRPA